MKILTIGDTHGRDCWKRLINDSYDKIIFTGDYVDSYDLDNKTIINNLVEIFKYKEDNPDNIVLLIGNHDIQYFIDYGYPEYGCTGFRANMLSVLNAIFDSNSKHLQLSYQIDNYLWTHAGITNRWFKKELLPYIDRNYSIDNDYSISTVLNEAFKNKEPFIFNVPWQRGGIDRDGGPLWADKSEFINHNIPLRNYTQIVGHNPVNHITTHTIDTDTKITFVDCLENKEEGYIIDI